MTETFILGFTGNRKKHFPDQHAVKHPDELPCSTDAPSLAQSPSLHITKATAGLTVSSDLTAISLPSVGARAPLLTSDSRMQAFQIKMVLAAQLCFAVFMWTQAQAMQRQQQVKVQRRGFLRRRVMVQEEQSLVSAAQQQFVGLQQRVCALPDTIKGRCQVSTTWQ